MKWSYLPPFGHACCPHCQQEFDLAESNPTFKEKAAHNDTLVYVLCPACHGYFHNGDTHIRKQMANACFVNFKVHGVCANGGMVPFAITTTLTLALNSGNLLLAIERGHGLTRKEYFSICAQEYAVTELPGGQHIIFTSSKAEGQNEHR